jgi:hypothetical protein
METPSPRFSERRVILAHYQWIEGVESVALVGEKAERGSIVIDTLITSSASVEDVSEENPAVIN